jgi:raffinose/stachyose/melibiose transport system permease protein
MSTTTTIVTGRDRRSVTRSKKRVEPIYYLFLLPALILFTLAITVPGIIGIVFSFTDSIGIGDYSFIGFINYIAAFSDPAILSSFLFTFGFSLVTVVVVNVAALLLAVGLTSRIRFKVGLRAIFVIPMVVSGIIIAYVFQFLFQNSLPALGIPGLETSILANPDLAWVGIVIVTAWQAIPGTLLIYIAGLLSIPGEVYEAADIDGANKRQQLLRITLPLVAGYIVINIILGFKNFLNAYDIIVGLTNGGPGTATRSIAMTIIRGFQTGDYAYQMATATLFFIVTIIIAVLQLSVTRGRSAL